MLHFSLLHSKTFRGFSSAQQTGSSLAPVPSLEASHSSMASASRHRWGSPVFGSDLGFVLSRYRTTRNPLFEGRFRPSTLDSVGVVAHKSTAPPSDVDGDFVELPPLPPFKQICAVLSTAQSHWLEVIDTRELASCERCAVRLQPTPDFIPWRHDEAARSSSPLPCTHNTKESRRSSRVSRLSVS